ncbi:MAG: methylated-DNA--[protein]-cysteine S-methyltransferase [bacterium]
MHVPLPAPLAGLTLRWSARGLTEARFEEAPPVATDDPHGVQAALAAWLAGDARALDAVPVDPAGTPFQRQVWALLRTLPGGQTWTYAELARRLGQPTATRAVARANATNPVALFIPCHRVLGSDGTLTGYAGGVARKRWLLAHEGAAGFLVP